MVRKSLGTDPYSSRIRKNPEVSWFMTRGVSSRIFPDSDFFRGKENPMSGHVIETWRVNARKFAYSFGFVENCGVPYMRTLNRVNHFLLMLIEL